MKIFNLEELDRPELQELKWRYGMLQYHNKPVSMIISRTPYELTWWRGDGSWIVVFDEFGVCYGVKDGLGSEDELRLTELLKNTDMDVPTILEFIEL